MVEIVALDITFRVVLVEFVMSCLFKGSGFFGVYLRRDSMIFIVRSFLTLQGIISGMIT